MGVAALRRFAQFIDDVLRGGLIGIAHTEIDDVFATRPGRSLEFINDVENVGWQALDALKIVVQGSVSVQG